MSKRDRDVLGDAVGQVIDINRTAISLQPDFVARHAMETIRFPYGLHNAGWYGCYQHILQLARERLRGKYDVTAKAAAVISGQADFFPETLQERYPRKPYRDPEGSWAEPEYILRAHLSAEDRWHNIDRLSHVSTAAARHKDALEAETVAQFGPRPRRAKAA
jgi:hypothetical protein